VAFGEQKRICGWWFSEERKMREMRGFVVVGVRMKEMKSGY
jgi:hypothetical protein